MPRVRVVDARWDPDEAGVVVLPSGIALRGRGLRRPAPPGRPPDFGLYLLGRRPPPTRWRQQWLPWRDFRTPSDPDAARTAIRHVYERAATGRVEVACGGGVGRTGTVLACCAVLDGMTPVEAVQLVRRTYHRRAVETPGQRRFIRSLAA